MAKILIVDDERSIRETLGEFVKDLGHEVFTAAEAASAVDIASQSIPDVVVSDIILPGVDGLALLERLHEISPDIQVIIITGEPTVDTAAVAVRRGAFDYLSKPVSREAIQSAVERALRVKEIVDERRRLTEENLRYREHLEEEVARKAQALAVSEEKYRTVVQNANEAVFVAQGATLQFANPKTSEITEYSNDELLAMPFVELIHPEDRTMVVERYQGRLAGGDAPDDYEFRILTANGDIRWIEIRPVVIAWEGQPATLNFASDITDRKLRHVSDTARQEQIRQGNEALLELAMHPALYGRDLTAALQLIAEKAGDVLRVGRTSIWLIDDEAQVGQCVAVHGNTENRARVGDAHPFSNITGFLDELERSRVIAASDVSSDPRLQEFDRDEMMARGLTSVLDSAVYLQGKLVGDITFDHSGEPRAWTHEDEEFAASAASLVALSLEASRRHEAEAASEQSEARYRALFEGSPISLWVEDFAAVKTFLSELKASGVEDLEAYFNAHPEAVDDCIRLVRIEDLNAASLELHDATTKEQLLGGLETVLTPESRRGFIRELVDIAAGATQFEITTTDRTLNGQAKHIALRWIAAPGYEKTLERVLLSKVDVSATVEAEAALYAALDGTIEAIGRTTETRDPYTAGHQRRVTELAVAIAGELGLADTTIAGIRAAGLMHDIGKMAIPAEILSKPSSLTETEMSLIKSHPQVAYEILESTAFPWPVADIVLQHHERMDGTGYPQGLPGEDIMIEARVLSVADTVEAMASHRPYRAALGIDVALEEIQSYAGERYDADVVAACLRLFAEDRFAFTPIDQLTG